MIDNHELQRAILRSDTRLSRFDFDLKNRKSWDEVRRNHRAIVDAAMS